ncbi:hypothetical protein VN97_g947 [Penicillium thymicola]|uniref:Uncharacterized protein n=1 Tax=Penicillium thymicola TaxID=293382 RepID=A0AAI9TRT9_PENTH|nr:hypothetical protein VN97_g947 [Penicillium thymicola]
MSEIAPPRYGVIFRYCQPSHELVPMHHLLHCAFGSSTLPCGPPWILMPSQGAAQTCSTISERTEVL